MTLAPGFRLGDYEIESPIGAGGMGEVYRARDTRLGRTVAIKILPDAFALDPDRLARFEREARMLAALNHPHIGGIHGFEEDGGVRGLVLEFVAGETLSDRLASGPLPVDEALTYARQIAEALEAAHEKGICHRDLKPSNIKITPEPSVKVLDFGLAKGDHDVAGSDLSHSPTITALGTLPNVILGTAAYMSPEQARGRLVDKRSDVWAFGCVLYEMLTGHQAFRGESLADTLSAILSRELDWQALPHETPPSIRRLLQRCVAKDPKKRLHDIADARIEIDDALSGAVESVVTSRRYPFAPALMTLAALALLGAGTLAGWLLSRTAAAPSVNRPSTVRYTLPATGLTSIGVPMISRDGRQIAFVASKTGGSRAIWIQPLDGEPREIPGTTDAAAPFWSPDGRSLGFFADGALKRVDLNGGALQRIARAEELTDGAWSSTGVILFSQRYALYQVAATGGTPTVVASLDLARQENSLRLPEFLPDGRRFLYVARSGRPENTSVYLASLDGGTPTRLFTTRSAVRLASPDRLLYLRDDALMAQSLDADNGKLLSTPQQVVGSFDPNLLGPLDFFSVSDTGVLAYRRPSGALSQLTWVDRMGRTVSTIGEPSNISNFKLSPDERGLVMDEAGRGLRSVWTVNLTTGVRARLTFEKWDDWQPIWSPDGLRILFGSYRDGPINMYVKPADGSGGDEVFMQSSIQKGPRDWSRDGRFILYTQDSSEMREDLFARRSTGNDEPIVIAATTAREFDGRFSFDVRWVSYVSNETGTDEVYVQPFPPTGGKWQISTGGGHSPRWRADGRELFYLTSDGEMRAVSIAAGQSFAAGPPRTLFTMSGIGSGGAGSTSYEVTRDGQRFLMRLTKGSPQPSPISIILNWDEAGGQGSHAP